MKSPRAVFPFCKQLGLPAPRRVSLSEVVATLLACVVALASPATWADVAAEQADSPQVQYRKAHEAIKERNWAEARRLLLGLWARAHTYDVASSLVYVENQLQHYAAAANYAAFALQNAAPVEKPEEIERLQRALDELKARVGTLTIVVNQPGAEITVDSQLAGTSPLAGDLYVDVGTHDVAARLGKGVPTSARIQAVAGQSYGVALTVEPEPAAAVAVGSDAGTAEETPPDNREPSGSHSYVPAVIAASVGGLGLVGGVVSFVVSANKHADAQSRLHELGGTNPCGAGADAARSTECADIAAQADGADTFRALGFVGIGTALAGGVLTFVLWPRGSASGTSSALSPSLSATQHGVFATVRGEL